MENIIEIIELAQRVDAALDDSERNVLSLTVSSNYGVIYNVHPQYFIKNFSIFDVKETNDFEMPFKLETEVEGVNFVAWLHREEKLLLQNLFSKKLGHKKSPLALACENGQLEQTFYPHYA